MLDRPLQSTQDLALRRLGGVPTDRGDVTPPAEPGGEDVGVSASCTVLDRVLVWLTVLALLASAAASLLGGTP